MSYTIYHQSLESATLTYSATADTNYPVTNLQDRYKNTFFKDTAIGASITIKVDFGSARACNYIILQNYIATAPAFARFVLKYGTADDGINFENLASDYEIIHSTSLTNFLDTFTSKTKRYWLLSFDNAGGDDFNNLQIGAIYLGTQMALGHTPEIGIVYSADYDVNVNQGAGGIRAGSINNATVRRIWQFQWKLLNPTDKTNLETFRDSVYMNKGLSRYPFIWSPDSGTTLYSARTNGELSLKQTAFEAYEWNAVFEEEL